MNKTKYALLAFLVALAPLVGAEVLGEDYSAGGCVVRTFVDDFTDELHSVITVCHSEGYEATFRLDFYFQSEAMLLSVFEYAHDGEEGTVTAMDVRIGAHPAMEFAGEWQSGVLEHAVTAVLSKDKSFAILDQLIDGSERLIYRIGKGHTRRVPLPEDMVGVVEEFANRMNPE